MRRTRGNGGRDDVPGQLRIDWTAASDPSARKSDSPLPARDAPRPALTLPWDFKTAFPRPTDEAIDAGRILDEDTTPAAIRSIHAEHAREALATLHTLDTVLDARRRGVDPATGAPPRTVATRERLAKRLQTEPERLEHAFTVLMDVYEEAFGFEARDAFAKAIRAWHAGIEVVAESSIDTAITTPEPQTSQPDLLPKTFRRDEQSRRIPARLPVPKPLPVAIAARRFGQEVSGKPVRPGPHEVREITEQHADKLIELLDQIATAPNNGKTVLLETFQNGLASYAEDFGQPATDQLEAYVRRQASLDCASRRGR
jgi:hypothetical protein